MKKVYIFFIFLLFIVICIIKFGFISIVESLESSMNVRLPNPSQYKILLKTMVPDDNEFQIWYYDNDASINLIRAALEEIDDDNFKNIRLDYVMLLSNYLESEKSIINENFDYYTQIINGNYYLFRETETKIKFLLYNVNTRTLYYMSTYKLA